MNSSDFSDSAIRIFILLIINFLIAWIATPWWISFLKKHRMGKTIRDDGSTPIFSELHKEKTGTPTMGGVIIWGPVAFTIIAFFYTAQFFDTDFFDRLNFFSRPQTYLPLGALIASALVGLFDDYLNVKKVGPKSGGLRMKWKVVSYFLIALVGAWWFFYKLNWDTLHVPFYGDLTVGIFYIPIFIFIVVATGLSVNEIDGLDGLSAGTLMSSFMAYGTIALLQGKVELAMFCGAIIGSLLAFLWFNIKPAKFMMGDTGAMSLGVTLAIVALLTDTALLLLVIGLPYVIESLSVIVQLTSKKFRGKKVFRSAPLHHHLESIGWPEYTIVMRFWVISGVTAVAGMAVYIIENGL